MKVKKHPHAGKTGAVRDFIELVDKMAGSRRHAEIFEDFLELSFCAVAKKAMPAGAEADAIEARYMVIASKREGKYLEDVARLLAITAVAHADGQGGDFLGVVSGELGALNTYVGQFFTPYELSKTMAMMTLAGVGEFIDKNGFVTLQEPACGAGGMVLACADVLRSMNFDPSLQMYAVAVDVSATAVKMAYLQLALSGIPATIVHGNTLSLEERAAYRTPAFWPFVSANQEGFAAWRRAASQPSPTDSGALSAPSVIPQTQPRQLNLFGATA